MFIISGRDAEGKMFVALRAFVPSECRWVFHYVWSFVVPKLLGDSIRRNQVLLTDGDANIYEPFCQLRQSLYPNSNHYLCFYHLVAKQLSIVTAGSKQSTTILEVKQKFYHILRKWMTTDEYLTQQEFYPAKRECERWLETLLKDPESQGIAQALQDFLIKSVYPRMEKILFMFRRGRFLEETTTNLAEIANSSMKRGLGGVKPNMSLDTSAQTIGKQAHDRDIRKRKELQRRTDGHNNWSASKTANIVTQHAESLIMNQTSLSDHYSILQLSNNSWVAKCHVPGYKGRVRRIELNLHDEDEPEFGHTIVGYLLCSCQSFDRMGLPCRHIIALLREVQPYHCDLRWNKELFHYQRVDEVTLMVNRFFKRPPMKGPEVTFDDIQCYLTPSSGASVPCIITGTMRDNMRKLYDSLNRKLRLKRNITTQDQALALISTNLPLSTYQSMKKCKRKRSFIEKLPS
jgi:hypothetical protein